MGDEGIGERIILKWILTFSIVIKGFKTPNYGDAS
jgi:hypothetical protein